MSVQAGDELPLATEPYAAAVDLVLTFIGSGFARPSIVELFRSPHFAFASEGSPLEARSVQALDRALQESRFGGQREALNERAAAWAEGTGRLTATALPALRCAMELADELSPLLARGSLGRQVAVLRSFLERHAAPNDSRPPTDREQRARAAVWTGLAALQQADERLNDADVKVDLFQVTSIIRRWMESHTFRRDSDGDGVHLVDAQAAAYGWFDDVFVAGLVESEWPARVPRNIFYPGGMLAQLGWPRERDRLRAARASFRDLIGLARTRVRLSAFMLEDDAIVTASPALEGLGDVTFERVVVPASETARDTGRPEAGPGSGVERDSSDLTTQWHALRRKRAQTQRDDNRLHGFVGPRPPRTYAVSALDRYLECPFKYFARDVLALEEEREEERSLTPPQRGLFVHNAFEAFFRSWQSDGEGAITLASLDRALARFEVVAEDALARLPPADRAVARAWLLGSAAAPGLAERVFVAEVEDPAEVVERLLEYRIDGRFEMGDTAARRAVAVRGTVDRIDLHGDGTFRVIDYKAGRPPQNARALQLPVYARCAEHQLTDQRGHEWRATDAAYIAFGHERLHVSVPRRDIAGAMAEGEARVLDVVQAIEGGVYPPRPAEIFRCTFCPYPTVCRKDYVEAQ